MLSDSPTLSRRTNISYWLPPFLLSLAATSLAAAGGATPSGCLALGIGASFIVAILVPIFCGGLSRWQDRIATFAAVLIGITGPCAIIFLSAGATAIEFIGVLMVLVSFALALAALVGLIQSLGLNTHLAAAFAIGAALIWLTWPIWLSTELSQWDTRNLANWLVQVHPPLVINGILTFTPPWTEQAIAYRLTVLNQDLPIRFATTSLRCVVFNLLFVLCLATGSKLIGGKISKIATLWRPNHQRS